MSIGRYALGFAGVLIVVGSIGIATRAIRRRYLPHWTGAPARLAEAVIGLALLIAILELLGTIGLFSLGPILAGCVAAGLAARAAVGGTGSAHARAAQANAGGPSDRPGPAGAAGPSHRPDQASAGGPSRARATAVVALMATAALAAEWAAPTLQSYDVGIRTLDSLWYHLPWAASFAQTGQITSLRFTDVEYLTAFYPATAELFHGLGIALLARDTLSPAINLLWLGLALLAGWCIGRPSGRAPATLLGAAVALALPMMYFSQAGSAANDIVGIFFLLASVALIVNARNQNAEASQSDQGQDVNQGTEANDARQGHRHASLAPAPLVLAAIAAGLAVSVKLSLLAPVLALTVGVIVLGSSGRRHAARTLATRPRSARATWTGALVSAGGSAPAAWIGALVLAGGFWYVRNLVAVGNPLPWLGRGILPTPDPPLQQHTAFSVAHYLGNTHLWSSVFGPGLASGLGPWWPIVLAAAVIGPLLCLLPGADGTLRMLGLVAIAALGAYVVTPESAAGPDGQPLGFALNLRYAAPALALALAILPLAPALGGVRRQAATLAVSAIVLAATLAQAQLWPARHLAAVVGVGAGVVAGGVLAGLRVPLSAPRGNAPRLAWLLAPRSGPLDAPHGRAGWPAWLLAPRSALERRKTWLAAIAALLVVGGFGGYAWQRHYLRGRYAFQPGVSYLAHTWALFRHVHDARVGVVGTFGGFFSYPLFGEDDSDRLAYVAHRGRHGSFTAISTCQAWRRAVNAGHFRYLLTTPGRDPWHPKALAFSSEGDWTASDPAARLIYFRRALGQSISVYRLRGALHPAACR
ncbi:MAG: hypothetical protein ACR2OB_15005 [Solirubrobacteraceae bacterium]